MPGNRVGGSNGSRTGLRFAAVCVTRESATPMVIHIRLSLVSDVFSNGLEAVSTDLGLSTGRPKKEIGKWILIGFSALVLIALMLLYLSYSHSQAAVEKLLIDPGRDYSRVPFNMIDATEYCQLKTQRRYGDSLALSYVDEHSTRIDSRTGIYKVFMFAHVGDLRDYDEEAIHCFVDPERRVLTHYRTINLEKASLMSKAAKFFERF